MPTREQQLQPVDRVALGFDDAHHDVRRDFADSNGQRVVTKVGTCVNWACPGLTDIVTATYRSREGVLMAREFSQEFKDQVVELYRRGRTFKDLAREFDLSATTISNWVRVADRKSTQPSAGEPPESDKAKVARLERELAERNEELEVLGKALAFFARRHR